MEGWRISNLFIFIVISTVITNYFYSIPMDLNSTTKVSTVMSITSSQMEFIDQLTKEYVPNVLHEVSSIYEWRLADLEYLSTATVADLIEEIEILRDELELSREPDIVTSYGTRIWGHDNVEWQDTLMCAINLRQQMLEGNKEISYKDEVAYIGGQSYQVIGKVGEETSYTNKNRAYKQPKKRDLRLVAEVLYDVIYQYDIPQDLITNLDIYISPYHFDGKLGFASTGVLIGRDEEIILGLPVSYQTTREDITKTIFHELGHVFDYDTLGLDMAINEEVYIQNIVLWEEVKKLHEEKGIHKTVEIRESIAEHVYFDLARRNDMFSRVDAYPMYISVTQFIEEAFESYAPYTERVVPDVKINGYTLIGDGNVAPIKEVFDGSPIQIELEYTTVRDKAILLDVYKVDESNKELEDVVRNYKAEEGEVVEFELDSGEYMLVLHLEQATIKINTFYIEN